MSRIGMLIPSCTIRLRLSACRKERLAWSSITIHALRLQGQMAPGAAAGNGIRGRWQWQEGRQSAVQLRLANRGAA